MFYYPYLIFINKFLLFLKFYFLCSIKNKKFIFLHLFLISTNLKKFIKSKIIKQNLK
jgi:hypothetical protein